MTTTICAPELVTLTVALHVLRGPNTQPHTDDCCQQVRTLISSKHWEPSRSRTISVLVYKQNALVAALCSCYLKLSYEANTIFPISCISFAGDYVFPEINKVWDEHQKLHISEITASGRRLAHGLDGQCDSPGHNATYSTVSYMDAETYKLLDFKVVNVKEVKNSQGKISLKSCLLGIYCVDYKH